MDWIHRIFGADQRMANVRVGRPLTAKLWVNIFSRTSHCHHKTWITLLAGCLLGLTTFAHAGEATIAVPTGEMTSGLSAGDVLCVRNGYMFVGAGSSTSAAGKVFVYAWDGSNWSHATTLTGSASGDDFGRSIAFGDSTLFVGSPNANGGIGSVTVFTVDGNGAWSSGTSLPMPTEVVANWKFGTSLSYSPTADGGTGGQLVVGVPSAKLNGSGTAGTDSGRVYVYTSGTSGGGDWSTATSTTLTDIGIVAGDKLGESVVMIGNEIYAGAPGTAGRRGAVYVFKFANSAWSLAEILADDESTVYDRRFGTSLCISGNRLLVGATNGNDLDGAIDPVIKLSGAAYVFERADANAAWSKTAKLQLSDPHGLETFGSSVAINGNVAVIGSPGTPGTGQALYRMGKAYVYTYNGSSWSPTYTLIPSNGASGDTFGKAVAIDGDDALVGSPAHDDSATSTTNVGGVYLYHLPTLNMPNLTITSPAEGPFIFADMVDGDMALTAHAIPTGSSTISKVEFFADGQLLGEGTLNGSSFDYTWANVTWAQHELQVRTVSNEGVASLSEPVIVYTTQSPRFDEQRLIANDGTSWDLFGYAVDVTIDQAKGNEYAIVGAHGDQANGEHAGSAYLFEKVNGTWTQVQKLTGPDATKYWEGFGFAVAIHGDKAYVGVTQDQTNEGSTKGPGTVYVFQRQSGAPGTADLWQPLGSPLVAWDNNINGSFGQSIAANDNTLAIGAPEDDESSTITDAGAVYVFTWSGSSWIQGSKLTTASEGGGIRTKDDGYGLSVAMDDTHLIVGCPGDDDEVNVIIDSGKVYVYALSDLTTPAILSPENFATGEAQTDAHFGESVAVHNGLAVIGAASATGSFDQQGKAYVAKLSDSNTWTALQILIADDAAEDDSFGVSVAIHDDLIAVGSFYDDENASNSGSVYLYQQPGINPTTGTLSEQFTQITKFGAHDASPDANFGIALAMSTNDIAVGNMLNSIKGQNAGAAYLFRKPKAPTIAITSPTDDTIVGTDIDVAVTVAVTANDSQSLNTPVLWSGGTQLINPTDNGNGTYTFNWHSPATNQTVQLKAVVTNTDTSIASSAVTVRTGNANPAPNGVPDPYAITLGNGNTNIDLSNLFTDADGDGLSYTVTGNNLTGIVSTVINGNILTITILQNAALTGTLTITATDAYGGTGTNTITLNLAYPILPGETFIPAPNVELASNLSAGASMHVDLAGQYLFVSNGPSTTAAGKVFVYTRDLTGWAYSTTLTNGIAGDGFGSSMAYYNGQLFVTSTGTAGTITALTSFTVDAQGNWSTGTDEPIPAELSTAGITGTCLSADLNTLYIGDPNTDNHRGAVYVIQKINDTWTLTQTLNDGQATTSDRRFGTSIAVSGNRLLIGASSGHDLDGTIDPVIELAGAAYVFERVDANAPWSKTAKLQLNSPQSLSTFGTSVALNGDTVVIGAPGTPGTGHALYRMGKAYVFDYDGNDWNLSHTLIPSDGASGDTFGKSVALQGDYAMVGCPAHDAGTTANVGGVYMYHLPTLNMPSVALSSPAEGPFVIADLVNGDMVLTADATAAGSSSIASVEFFVDGVLLGEGSLNGGSHDYTWSGVTWAQHELQVRTISDEGIAALSAPVTIYATQAPRFDEQRLIANDGTSWDLFGYAVDITIDSDTGNEYAIVGAHGDQANGEHAGSAYLFEKVDGTWTQVQKLTGPDATRYWEGFGFAVAIHGDKAYVGVTQDSTESGTKGPGTVYVYQRTFGAPGTPDLWQPLGSPLVAWDNNINGSFGQAIAANDSYLAIGAPEDDESSTISDAGAVYVFTWSGSAWMQGTKLVASERTKDDGYGLSVAMDTTHLIVGCPGDDETIEITDSGKVYFYNLSDLSSPAILSAEDFNTGEAQKDAHFGESVAIDNGLAVIGAASATIITGSEGKAYVAKRINTNTWTALQILTADDAAEDDSFGVSVAIHDDLIAVGSFFDDDNASNTGSVYLFQQPGINPATGTLTDQFTQLTKFGATDASPDANFGISLAMSANDIAVGNMLNSIQGQNAGTAYLFRKPKAPTIAITTPAPGSQVQNNTDVPVTVAITLNDNKTITTPTLWVGSTQLTTPTDNGNGTYTFTWHTPAADQTLQLKATVTNAESMTATASIDVQVQPAGVAPVVAMKLPTAGTTIIAGQNITLQATATDSDGTITNVQFFANGTLAGQGVSVGNNVYELVWTAPTSLIGNVQITAIATDSQALAQASAPVAIAITTNSSPVVTLTSPAAGSSFGPSGTIALSASASDPDGTIASVVFYRGNIPIGLGQYDSGTQTFIYNWNAATVGTHELSAIATDNHGAAIQSTKVSIEVKLVPLVGLALWLTADTGVAVDSSNLVSTWQDQSGNGRDVTQASSSNQPLFVANQANHRPVVRFDGVNDSLSTTLANSYTGASSVVIVARLNNLEQTDGAAAVATDTTASANSFELGIEGQSPGNWVVKQDSANKYTIDPATSSFVMLTVVIEDEQLEYYLDGELIGLSDISLDAFKLATGYLLGRNRAGTAYADMDLAQVLVYHRPLEADELSLIHQTFQSRYAIGQTTSVAGNTSAIKLGCNWLASVQNSDGSWSEQDQAMVDTVEAFRTLVAINCGVDALNNALPYISTWNETDLFTLSRKVLTLSNSTADISKLTTTLIGTQREDGGWGLGDKKQSDPLDTMIVTETLLKTNADNTAVLTAARDYLSGSQLADGSWGFVGEESQSDVVRTAIGLIVLKQLENADLFNARAASAMSLAQNFLEGKQVAGGGFGDVAETAWSYLALIKVKQPAQLQSTLTSIQNAQLDNGSWADKVYETAVAMRALGAVQPPTLEAAPDLMLQSSGLTFNPAAVEPGTSVTITAVVFNTGTAEATDVTVEFFNRDPRLGGTAIGQAQVIGSIPADGSVPVTVSYDTTGLVESQQIVVFVDRVNTIAESSEINNVISATLPINADPDLAVSTSDFTLSQTSPQAFERFTVQALIHNNGGRFTDSYTVRVLDNGVKLTDLILPGMSAGASSTASLTLGLPVGNHTLAVVLDPERLLSSESNVSNNTASVDITVTAPPTSPTDLVITSLSVDPTVAKDDQTVTVTIRASNQGGQAAGDSFNVDLSDGSTVLHTFNVPDLAAGQQAVLTYTINPGTLVEGSYQLTALIDSASTIDESIETNNELSTNLLIVSTAIPADLAFASFSISPATVDEGAPATLLAQIVNTGTTTAENVTVRFTDGPVQLDNDIVFATLAGGAVATVQMEVNFEPGTRTITATLDPTNTVTEADETNNKSQAVVRVRKTVGLPDLAITTSDVTFSNSNPNAFSQVQIRARIYNNGDNTAENVVVRFMDNGEKLADLTLSGVNVGRSNDAILTTALSGGSHAITVQVDPDSRITEKDETNNQAVTSIQVNTPPVSPPELLIQSITLEPSAPIEGESVTLKITVDNQGGQAAGSSFDVSVQDNSADVHTFNLADLTAGGRSVLNLTTSFTAGNHAIAVTVDSGAAISETDETNNLKTLSVNVPSTATPPDLVVTRFEPTPNTIDSGDLVNLVTVITNTGTQTASHVVLRITQNGQPITSDFTIASLAGGHSAQFQVQTALPTGSVTLLAVVDPDNQVGESNENNNQSIETVTVNGVSRPDLVITSSDIQFSNDEPKPGQTIQITATVYNQGNLISDPFKVLFTRGDPFAGGAILIGQVNAPAIAPGGSTDVIVNATLPAGQYQVYAFVDSDQIITESSESNNLAFTPIQTAPVPDLYIDVSNIHFSHTNLDDNANVLVQARVDNIGEGDAQNVEVIFASPQNGSLIEIGRYTIDSLPGGSSSIVETLWQPQTGKQTLVIMVDNDAQIVESNETNNLVSVNKTFTLSDLVMQLSLTDGTKVSNGDAIHAEGVLHIELVNPISGDEIFTFAQVVAPDGEYLGTARVARQSCCGQEESDEFTLSLPRLLPGEYTVIGQVRKRVPNTTYSAMYLQTEMTFTVLPTFSVMAVTPFVTPDLLVKGSQETDLKAQISNVSNMDWTVRLVYKLLSPSDVVVTSGTKDVLLPASQQLVTVTLETLNMNFTETGLYRLLVNVDAADTPELTPVLFDLNGWQVKNDYLTGDTLYGQWVVDETGYSVTQKNNAKPSIFLNPQAVSNQKISGIWRVDDNTDDDYIGFVFGYQDASHFYMFDWKQAEQWQGLIGMTVRAVGYSGGSLSTDFDVTNGDQSRVRTIYHNDIPWNPYVNYQFDLSFHDGHITIAVTNADTLASVETIDLDDNTYSGGLFGFYNFSQANVTYSGFTYEPAIHHVVSGQGSVTVEGEIRLEITKQITPASIPPLDGETVHVRIHLKRLGDE